MPIQTQVIDFAITERSDHNQGHQVCLITQELVLSQSAYLGRQMEVLAAFSIGAKASTGNSTAQSPFAVGLQLDTGNGTYTRISINGTAAALQTGDLQIMQVTIQLCGHDGSASERASPNGMLKLKGSFCVCQWVVAGQQCCCQLFLIES